MWATATAPTMSIGGKLCIAVVTVEVDEPFALLPGSIYSYNVTLSSGSLPRTDLRTEFLLIDEDAGNRIPNVDPKAPFNLALGYASGRLPSFATCPTTIDDLFLVQAGCRNTGSTRYDTTQWIDEVIADGVDDPLERPHQLYLTGDQIYADSISTAILPMINRLAVEIIEFGETFPTRTANHEATLRNFPAGRRGKMCQEVGGFSTGSANHLLSFGEFCAAYLMAWSPGVWTDLPNPDVDMFVDNDASLHSELQELLTPYKKNEDHDDPAKRITNPAEWKTHGLENWESHVARTVLYRNAVPAVRRALANCATYMIFDDHEVTDDWLMTRDMFDRIATSPVGRSVMRNGLAAYCLFQAWGNDPKKFATGANGDMLTKSGELIGIGVGGPMPNTATAIEAHIGLGGSPPDVEWWYEVDGPMHKTVVIDTRTRRSYATRTGPAKLLGSTTNSQVPEGPLTDGRELLLLIAPQPPLMPTLFDSIAQPLGGATIEMKNSVAAIRQKRLPPPHEDHTGQETLEGESWGLEEFGLEDLLARLAPYKKVLILSGDVHFSGGVTMDYWRKGQPAADRFVQLILSPSRHQWPNILHNFLRVTALSQRFAELGMPAERLAWKKASDVLVPPSLEHVPPGLAARMRRDPAMVPAQGWAFGTDYKQADGADVLPDWRWRIKLLTDERPEIQRPPGVQLPVPGPDLDPADPIDGYFKIAARHQLHAATQQDHLRRLVFNVGIGLIRFGGDSTSRTVTHTILSRTPALASEAAPNTVHTTSLEPTGEDPPTIQFHETIGQIQQP